MTEKFRQAMIKAGLTNKFLLKKTEEFIKVIENGEYRPINPEKKLGELKETKRVLEIQIERGEE
jgi:hypothetical protein